MELPFIYLREIGNNAFLLVLVILGIITISLFNFGGVSITKLFDALTRSLLNVTKTAFVWIIGIIITLLATSPEYKLESLNIFVNLIKVVGFSSIIMGTLIYNRLIFQNYFPDSTEKESLLESEEE